MEGCHDKCGSEVRGVCFHGRWNGEVLWPFIASSMPWSTVSIILNANLNKQIVLSAQSFKHLWCGGSKHLWAWYQSCCCHHESCKHNSSSGYVIGAKLWMYSKFRLQNTHLPYIIQHMPSLHFRVQKCYALALIAVELVRSYIVPRRYMYTNQFCTTS